MYQSQLRSVFTSKTRDPDSRRHEMVEALEPLINPLLERIKAMSAASFEAADQSHLQMSWDRHDFLSIHGEPTTMIRVFREPDRPKDVYYTRPFELAGEPYGEEVVACLRQPMMRFEFRTFINGEKVRPLVAYDYNDGRFIGEDPDNGRPDWKPVFTSDSLDAAQATDIIRLFDEFMDREFGKAHAGFIRHYAGRHGSLPAPQP